MIFACSLTSAQNKDKVETLFGPRTKIGGYAAFSVLGTISDKAIPKIGGYGGILIDRRFTLGGGGYGYTSATHLRYGDSTEHFAGGYGGLFLEPIIGSTRKIHVSFPMLIGAGGHRSFSGSIDSTGEYHFDRDDRYPHRAENYFMLEPGVNLEVNLTRFLRVGLTATYMFTTLTEPTSFAAKDLENASIGFNIRLGWM